MFKLYRCSLLTPCFVLFLIFSTASAEQKNDRLQPMDIFNMQSVTDPQISPDGKKIVYVRRFSDITTDKNYSNLWIVSFDGSDNRPLTSGNRNETSPRWSPDGGRIIYVSEQDGK